MHEAKKVRFAVFLSLDRRALYTFICKYVYASAHLRVCMCVYKLRDITVISPLCPPSRGSSPSTFLAFSYAFLFATLLSFPPPSLFLSLSSSSLCQLSVSSSRRLDEKSEYATIFKWQPRDTLLNALFASPPTSPPRPPLLSIAHSLATSTDGPFWLPTRQRRARCLIKNSPTLL